jgi:integrase/recombinase XerC
MSAPIRRIAVSKVSGLTVVPEPSPFEARITDFLDEKRAGGASRKTIELYAYTLREVLLPFCQKAGVTEPAGLTARHLNAFSLGLIDGTGSRSGRPLSKPSVDSYARTVNTFLMWLAKQGEGEAPVARVQRQRIPRRVVEVLSREDIRNLEDAAPNERDKLIIRVLADTGIRLGELLGLRVEDIRQEPGRKWYLKVLGKGDKERLVPIQPSLAARLDRYAKRTRKDSLSDRLFLGNRRQWRTGDYEPLTETGTQQMIRRLGLEVLGRRVHPHLFRHSFVTEQLRRGMTPTLVARIVGHSSLAMVDQVYQHLTVTDAHDALMRTLMADGSR